MRILCIVPLPPPMTGNSLAVKILLDELGGDHELDIVNLSKQSFANGIDSIRRVGEIVAILVRVWRRQAAADVIYFTISESKAGNVKDLLIYALCFTRLRRMVVHLHGGAGMRGILAARRSIIGAMNRFFLRRLGAVIVLGRSHAAMYAGTVSPERQYTVPNFAEDYLFVEEPEIREKFRDTARIRLLFLSNLIEGKGHNELLDAYAALEPALRDRMSIDFAGGFETVRQGQEFVDRIASLAEALTYHGVVDGGEKLRLFSRAHVFCLPTYYAYEGQPISILEAYAAGCVVITTNHSGIPDVFRDGLNGIAVRKRSAESIRSAIERIAAAPESLLAMAIANHREARAKYRTTIYNASLRTIVEGVGSQSAG